MHLLLLICDNWLICFGEGFLALSRSPWGGPESPAGTHSLYFLSQFSSELEETGRRTHCCLRLLLLLLLAMRSRRRITSGGDTNQMLHIRLNISERALVL